MVDLFPAVIKFKRSIRETIPIITDRVVELSLLLSEIQVSEIGQSLSQYVWLVSQLVSQSVSQSIGESVNLPLTLRLLMSHQHEVVSVQNSRQFSQFRLQRNLVKLTVQSA